MLKHKILQRKQQVKTQWNKAEVSELGITIVLFF